MKLLLKLFSQMIMMFFLSAMLLSCSSVQESEEKAVDSTNTAYVFDDVILVDSTNNSAAEVIKTPEIATKPIEMYIVQIGAFTTKEKAELFLSKFANKINYDFNIHFDEIKGLYLIQIPPFRTKEEADKVRDEIKTIPELEGTFIVY